jgi:hypothetical protein
MVCEEGRLTWEIETGFTPVSDEIPKHPTAVLIRMAHGLRSARLGRDPAILQKLGQDPAYVDPIKTSSCAIRTKTAVGDIQSRSGH